MHEFNLSIVEILLIILVSFKFGSFYSNNAAKKNIQKNLGSITESLDDLRSAELIFMLYINCFNQLCSMKLRCINFIDIDHPLRSLSISPALYKPSLTEIAEIPKLDFLISSGSTLFRNPFEIKSQINYFNEIVNLWLNITAAHKELQPSLNKLTDENHAITISHEHFTLINTKLLHQYIFESEKILQMLDISIMDCYGFIMKFPSAINKHYGRNVFQTVDIHAQQQICVDKKYESLGLQSCDYLTSLYNHQNEVIS